MVNAEAENAGLSAEKFARLPASFVNLSPACSATPHASSLLPP